MGARPSKRVSFDRTIAAFSVETGLSIHGTKLTLKCPRGGGGGGGVTQHLFFFGLFCFVLFFFCFVLFWFFCCCFFAISPDFEDFVLYSPNC